MLPFFLKAHTSNIPEMKRGLSFKRLIVFHFGENISNETFTHDEREQPLIQELLEANRPK
jgi:hypothetical protein